MNLSSLGRAPLIAGIIMIAVGIFRLTVGPYPLLGIVLVGLGLLAILIPLRRSRRSPLGCGE